MDSPGTQRPPQMRLTDRNQEIQALAAECPQQPFTIAIRHGSLDRRPKDLDTHRGDGRVQPRRVDVIPIVEHEPVAMRGRQDLPELLQGPGGGRVGGGVDAEQAATADLKRDKDVQEAERCGDHETEVTGDERLGVIPDERRPQLPGPAGLVSSAPTLAPYVPANGTW